MQCLSHIIVSVLDRKCQWGQIGSSDLDLVLLLQAIAHVVACVCVIQQM
jgi:hypothetical protein